MGGQSELISAMTSAVMNGLDDLIPEVTLDLLFTNSGSLSDQTLQAFYHWPSEVARSVTSEWIGGAHAHSNRDPASAQSGLTTVSRLAILYPSAERASEAGKELSSWLVGALASSSETSDISAGQEVDWGEETFWSLTSTYLTPNLERGTLDRAEFGWRRGPVLIHSLVFGLSDVTERASQIAVRLDALVSDGVSRWH